MKVGDRVETPDGSHHDIIRITEDSGVQLSDCYFYCRSELKLVDNKPTKTELIDKAIDDLGGDISKARLCDRKGNIYLRYDNGYVLCHPNSLAYAGGDYFCTIEEFEQRKKEREMERNSNNSWYDYENQRMLKLPPVGEIVLVKMASGKEHKAKVLEITHNGTIEIFIVRVFNGNVEGIGDLVYKDKARPLDWDKLSKRKHVVDTAANVLDRFMLTAYRSAVEELYDAGMLKLPEEGK